MRAPDPRPRPKLAHWRFERGLSLIGTAGLIVKAASELGLEVSCSDETVRLICLPFEDPRRRVPRGGILQAIEKMTAGQIGEPDFYPIRTAA